MNVVTAFEALLCSFRGVNGRIYPTAMVFSISNKQAVNIYCFNYLSWLLLLSRSFPFPLYREYCLPAEFCNKCISSSAIVVDENDQHCQQSATNGGLIFLISSIGNFDLSGFYKAAERPKRSRIVHRTACITSVAESP